MTAFVLLVPLVLAATVAFGCGSANSSSSASAIAQGQSVFGDHCARCHGQHGQGVTGPNLQHETDLSKVENQVRNGGQIMPSFGGQLSDAQISAVAQYVLSLAGK